MRGASALLARLDDLDPQSLGGRGDLRAPALASQADGRRSRAVGGLQLGRRRLDRRRERSLQPDGHEPGRGGLRPPSAALRCRQPHRTQAHGLRRRHHHGPFGGRDPDPPPERRVLGVAAKRDYYEVLGVSRERLRRRSKRLTAGSPATTTRTSIPMTPAPKSASRSSPRPTRCSPTPSPAAPTIPTGTRSRVEPLAVTLVGTLRRLPGHLRGVLRRPRLRRLLLRPYGLARAEPRG